MFKILYPFGTEKGPTSISFKMLYMINMSPSVSQRLPFSCEHTQCDILFLATLLGQGEGGKCVREVPECLTETALNIGAKIVRHSLRGVPFHGEEEEAEDSNAGACAHCEARATPIYSCFP